ncbi:MAG: ribosomal-processing cysteine protease Prp [Leptospiraceae bacterium]|nr:ribosomal-processing cysteine protease Prp [Leptospiraceae bacterium]
MIIIEIRKDKKGNYTGLISEGHAPDSFGKKGNNILCAAISTLVQTLHLHLKIMSNVSRETIRKGFLELEVSETNKETNLSFEVIMTGIHNLNKQYPEEIQLVESNT